MNEMKDVNCVNFMYINSSSYPWRLVGPTSLSLLGRVDNEIKTINTP
jgi:hypothetical protein